jgi:hypothetical protein
MADNLETYFKKHLSEDTPAEDNWNVPTDEVWNKVVPEIQKKRGIFIPWKYFIIIGGLMLAGLVIILWPSNEADVIPGDDKAIVQEAAIQAHSGNPDAEEINTTPTTVKEESPQEGQQIAESTGESIPSSEESVDIKSTLVDDQNPGTKDQAISSPSADQKTTYVATVYKPDQELVNPRSGTLHTDESTPHSLQDQDKINHIPTLKSSFIATPDNLHSPLLNLELVEVPSFEIEKEVIDPFDNKGKIGIGAFFAPTWNNTYVLGDMDAGELETGSVFLYSGNWGIEAKYFLSNRFTIVLGVERSEIKSWSRSIVDFDYDASTEHEMPTGEMENTSPVPMPTPFGDINTEITYRFPGNQEIQDGEPMNSAYDTHQEINYWSVPLGIEYNILRFPKLTWFAEGGIRYNRAIRDAAEFTSRILHEGDDMEVVDEVMTGHPVFTENYLNFYVGTGISYQFSESFLLSGSGRYFGNITKVNLQDNMSTYIQGFNLKLGFIYLF